MYKKSFKEFKEESLRDAEIRRHYEEMKPRFELITLMLKKRREDGLTQVKLAKRMGTQQSAIARFESGNVNPTLKFMYRIADALGAKMSITITKK